MQSAEIKAFKNQLRRYTYLCSRLNTLTNSIEYLYDRLGGVRGIDPSKEPTHSQPNKELEYKLRDDIEHLEAKLKHVVDEKVEIDEILNLIETPVREAITEVNIYGHSIDSVSAKYYLSHTGLQKRMDKAIKGALNEIHITIR